jgi:signal transduction histidine kinase
MAPAPIARASRFSLARRELALPAIVSVLVVLALGITAAHRHEPLLLLLAPVAVMAVLLRARTPIPALLFAIVVTAVIPDDPTLLLPALVVLFAMASRRSWQVPAAAALGVAAVSIVATAGWGGDLAAGGLLGFAVGSVGSCAAAVALGLYVGARRRLIDGLRERAERLDRERELLADRAVALERVRIAQELHDVIAHNVSLMVVQAQGLGAAIDDARVASDTRAIADLGRHAMAEMHRTLRLLRADGAAAELAPQPGLANIDRLVEQARSAGLSVELTVQGQPRVLPQSEDLSAFRIVQEALTNLVKHAAGADTHVTLDYADEGLRLTIADAGDAPDATREQTPGDGHGLVGMRERVAMFGGTLSARPRAGRGFEVTAVLPYLGADS